MEELKKAKWLRFLYRLLFLVVAVIVPSVLMISRFELTKETTEVKTTITFYGSMALFLAFVLVWKYRSQLMEWIRTWEYSALKYIIIGFSKVWIYFLVCAIIFVTKNAAVEATRQLNEAVNTFYNNLEYCVFVICVCECIAYLVFYPLENKYDERVKRLIRKKERIEDYKEAAA